MTAVIAVSGKGGTGKTTLAALMISYLIGEGLKPVLAVDADSNSNLDLVLGVELPQTIGGVREELSDKVQKQELPAGVSKQDILEMQVEQALVETEDFDLISMGRPEGPGCYCAINNMLRVFLDRLSEHYRFAVIDNEAGMEHLSRRTTRNIDLMFIVSDPSQRGIETAERIHELAKSMELNVGKYYLVLSRMRGPLEGPLEESISKLDFELAGIIPEDPEVTRLDAQGKPLVELNPQTPARKAVNEILETVLQEVSN